MVNMIIMPVSTILAVTRSVLCAADYTAMQVRLDHKCKRNLLSFIGHEPSGPCSIKVETPRTLDKPSLARIEAKNQTTPSNLRSAGVLGPTAFTVPANPITHSGTLPRVSIVVPFLVNPF